MPKRAPAIDLQLNLTFCSGLPRHRQLYSALKRAVLDGQFRSGNRLPSTRSLARTLGISRTTVLDAFEQLSAEGYLEGKVGSGTRVACCIPGNPERASQRLSGRLARSAPRVSQRAHLPIEEDLSFLQTSARPLRPGQPESSLFPRTLWSRLAAKHWRRANRDPEHIDSLGYRPLRKAIADYLARIRGVRCEPDQVLIVGGAQQALYLCAYTLLDPGESVWMEDPGYPRARRAFLGAGLKVVPVPVDAEGINVAVGRKSHPSPRLVFVTPSFQCPLGSMMSLARRFELLQMAKEQASWILEDDYFHEYRFGTAPVACLQSIDETGRVIYIGNFSKSVAPSLRIGYLVLPPGLVESFQRARSTISRQPPGVEQAILAEFITEGHLEWFIKMSLRVYSDRRDVLAETIRKYGEQNLEISPSGVGMYLVAWLKQRIDDRDAALAAAAHGVDAIPLSAFCSRPLRRKGLVLGYSGYEPERIQLAARRVCEVLSAIKT